VTYEASDGRRVPAYLFTPEGKTAAESLPAIVWVHGDGVNQNYDGWHIEREYSVYYSMHQYLVQQGYVVLAVDYRGSIGYGRKWREGHYRDLGGKDYQDVAAGVDFLERQGFVDTDRVGIWGLSYGGFLTLQGLTVTPELFACGIDVAGVVDWRMWYRDPGGSWIESRMGPPEESPELYDRTAPINRVERIQRPLAILHGTADVNVPFLESVRLIDELLKTGETDEFEMYPGEYHYFQRAHVLDAAWKKVDQFFGSCLKPN
jgi:dipeptidyl aminopeptidase/acylaminoacyl peptidase